MYERYVKLRDKKGVKDADVAKATGITKSTFSDWKNGRSEPKDKKLQKIADYFGVSTYYLRTGKQPKEITIDPKPLKKAFDMMYEDAAPGLSAVIEMYQTFNAADRKDILALMNAKMERYIEKKKEGTDIA